MLDRGHYLAKADCQLVDCSIYQPLTPFKPSTPNSPVSPKAYPSMTSLFIDPQPRTLSLYFIPKIQKPRILAAFSNLPIKDTNCLLDTALVLTSDNFLLNFPPSIPLTSHWWHLSKTHYWCHLCLVFTYIHSLLIEKVCVCLHVHFLLRSLPFLARVFPFISLTLCYYYII